MRGSPPVSCDEDVADVRLYAIYQVLNSFLVCVLETVEY